MRITLVAAGMFLNFQSPMGKVKLNMTFENWHDMGRVSIPYGKGKVNSLIEQKVRDVIVSIPYGKGKVKELYPYLANNNVSIPYGKGKANGCQIYLDMEKKYQFPMGKVK